MYPIPPYIVATDVEPNDGASAEPRPSRAGQGRPRSVHSAVHPGLLAVTFLVPVMASCGGIGPLSSATAPAASGSSASAPINRQIVIRTRVAVASHPGGAPIAAGEILQGSTIAGLPFCSAGTIRDSHASVDRAVEPSGLVNRVIRCPHGTIRMALTRGRALGLSDTGSWTLLGGTGAFDGLSGSGVMEVGYDTDDESLARETLTGTVSA